VRRRETLFTASDVFSILCNSPSKSSGKIWAINGQVRDGDDQGNEISMTGDKPRLGKGRLSKMALSADW